MVKLATQQEADSSLRGGAMAYAGDDKEILIIYNDGVARNIPAYMLDQLIRGERIIAFRRADGWVNVARGPLRKHQRPSNRSGSWGH